MIANRLPILGATLTAHPDVDKVAFTGSTATGQQIVRASYLSVRTPAAAIASPATA